MLPVVKTLSHSIMTAGEIVTITKEGAMIFKKVPVDEYTALFHNVNNELETALIEIVALSGGNLTTSVTGSFTEEKKNRDSKIKKLRNYILGQLSHLQEKETFAAAQINGLLAQYAPAKLPKKSQEEKSHALSIFLTEIKKPEYSESVETLGIKGLLSEVAFTNDACTTLHLQQVKENAVQDDPEVSSTLELVESCFNELSTMLKPLARRNRAVYKPIIDELNELITEILSKAHARVTRKAKKKSAVEEPSKDAPKSESETK